MILDLLENYGQNEQSLYSAIAFFCRLSVVMLSSLIAGFHGSSYAVKPAELVKGKAQSYRIMNHVRCRLVNIGQYDSICVVFLGKKGSLYAQTYIYALNLHVSIQ